MSTAPPQRRDPVPPDLRDAVADEASLRRFLHGLPGVDPVGVESRAAGLATRSIKAASKLRAIDLAISMVDLTTLEGSDTAGKVRTAGGQGPGVPIRSSPMSRPSPRSASIPTWWRWPPASWAAPASASLPSRPPSPSGRSSLAVKLADTRLAIDAGATEVDMVIDRGAFLAGHYGKVFLRDPGDQGRVRFDSSEGDPGDRGTGHPTTTCARASWLAMLAGGDFIKTSTGKISPAATLPVIHVMLQAVHDWFALTGERVAVKPAGGIRNTKDALRYLVAVREVAGPEWLDPFLFRFGASSLLNDLLMQRRAQTQGHYSGPNYVTVD